MRAPIPALLLLAAPLAACDTASPPIAGPAFLTARIDDAPFAVALGADSAIVVPSAANVIRLGGTNADGSMTMLLTIPRPATIGTHYLGCDQLLTASLQFVPSVSAPAGRRAVTGCLAIGQVEVTAVDTAHQRIAGRFVFNAMDDADSLVHVRDGQFAGSYVQPSPSVQ